MSIQQAVKSRTEEGKGDLTERYEGVISLLRFFKRANQLYMIDRFANAPDSHTALEVIREMEAIVLRLTPTTITIDGKERKNICLHDTIRESNDAALYRRLGAIVGKDDKGNTIYAVPCPKLPKESELEELRKDIDSYRLKPAELAALALATKPRTR